MKKVIVLFCGVVFIQTATCQIDNSNILSQQETERIFTDSVKKTFDIQFSIFRVYAYEDILGKHYYVLTENFNGMSANGDSLYNKIKAFHFNIIDGVLTKKEDIFDFPNKEYYGTSISFWTRYCCFKDIDNDGLVEPIVIYGTKFGEMNEEQFWVKILVYYKGKKYAIRHHNCTLDFCRFTQIDKTFYDMPTSVQNEVKNIMRTIESHNNAYFGHWEYEMKQKTVKF